jgi:hypothetical protein
VPVLMHGIMVGSFHRLTRAAQYSRSFAKLSPRCEGGVLASVTRKRPLGVAQQDRRRAAGARRATWRRR